MDTSVYAKLLLSFGNDLMRIAENAEAAADNAIKGGERVAAIEQAIAKMAEYEASVAKIASESTVLEAQFVKRFAFDVGMLRESLERIEQERKAGNEP